MKVNILVGGRFHSVMLADTLCEAGADIEIYSSAPPRKFRSQKFAHRSHFVPMFASIASQVTPFSFSRFETQENWLFDHLSSYQMRKCDVLHGWAGYSLSSAKRMKAQGSSFFLERSCPHISFQEDLIEAECERLQIPFRPKSRWWVERSLEEYDVADAIIVPSEYSLRSFVNKVDSEKIFVVPLDRPVKLPPEKIPDQEKPLVVGCLGGNIARKGFLYLLEAWEQLGLKDAKLLLKTDEAELRKSPVLSHLLNRCTNIETAGYFEDINDFYKQCDVFCLPSIDDGFGMAVTEALANSLPVIVTTHVGASELVRGTNLGFVVPSRDSAQLAEKLRFFYQNRQSLIEMARSAYQFAQRLSRGGSLYEKAVKNVYASYCAT